MSAWVAASEDARLLLTAQIRTGVTCVHVGMGLQEMALNVLVS